MSGVGYGGCRLPQAERFARIRASRAARERQRSGQRPEPAPQAAPRRQKGWINWYETERQLGPLFTPDEVSTNNARALP